MDDDLPTELWVAAHVRKCTALGMPVYISRKGASQRGILIVKLLFRDRTCRVLSQTRDLEGDMGWLDPNGGVLVDEKAADQYIQRAVGRDPDLWVVEVETHDGANPFEGKVF